MRSMEQESENCFEIKDVIFNYPKRPSEKSIVIGIPMFVYQIQTNRFMAGLNLFQTAILKFKSRPGFPDNDIAGYLGIDVKLVCAIKDELVDLKLLDGNGALTELGKTQRKSLDGLIVDGNHKRIGYIFRYLSEDKFYPYYVKSYRTPNVTSDNEPMIIGLKGDDYKIPVLYAKEILGNILNTACPDEKKVVELIRRSNARSEYNEIDDSSEGIEKLSIKFLPDERPSLVWICTYAYLKECGTDIYESDWNVLDPFAERPEDSTSLKLYIKLNAPELTEQIEDSFADVQTIERKKFREANFEMAKQVSNIILKDFPLPPRVDNKFLGYLRTIVRTKLSQGYLDYSDEAPAREFANAFQGLFENLFTIHRERHPNEYRRMLEEFDIKSKYDLETKATIEKSRKDILKDIFQYLFHKDVPAGIYSAATSRLDKPKALRGYFVALILTRMYSDEFYMLVLKYHNELDHICELRNFRGHGHSDKQNANELLTQEQIEEEYRFLKSFIYDYTNL